MSKVIAQFLQNPDDGKVSVTSIKVEGMCGFIEMPVTHAMMMRNELIIAQVINYISERRFLGDEVESGLCRSVRIKGGF